MASLVEYFPNDGDLEAYIRHLADLMGLKDWRIDLDDKAPDDNHEGECDVLYGQRRARIRLAEHDSIEDLRQTIVHELLHCPTDCLHLPMDDIRNTLGQPLYDATRGSLTDYIEQVVDAIATSWAETMPLPTGGKAVKKAPA